LPRGTAVRGGDVLVAEDGSLIQVLAAPAPGQPPPAPDAIARLEDERLQPCATYLACGRAACESRTNHDGVVVGLCLF
jgi:hypothetical protein